MKQPIVIALVAACVAVALVLAIQWRVRSERAPVAPVGTTQARAEDNRSGAAISQGATPPASSPSPVAAQDAAAPLNESITSEEDFEAAVARIDPSLIGRNLIQRAGDPASDGPAFDEVDERFSAESVDAGWSDGMEARILDQVAQIPNLGLASIEAECRQTICRVKLFYPPGTNALSSLEKLRPIARQIGFARVVEVATLGEQGVPISLLYFVRDNV